MPYLHKKATAHSKIRYEIEIQKLGRNHSEIGIWWEGYRILLKSDWTLILLKD